MNYLKKKIKTVVHGNKPKDDDDDFDNYVPEIPPHPSTLAENGLNSSSSTNFANFDSSLPKSDSAFAIGPIPLPLPSEEPKIPPLSLEELKAKEEEERKLERERLKKLEEQKKDSEEWKFFLSLTAKVDEVTNKTQTVLSKLQEESTIKDISVVEDPTFSDRYDETAPRTPGAWAAFEETEEYNPADPIFKFPPPEEQQQAESEKKDQPELDEETKRIAKELIEDFGFLNPAPGIPLVVDDIKPEEVTLDPFDTSYIDVEAIKNGEFLVKPTLIKDISLDEVDPFDTSYIESTIKEDSVVKN